VVLKSNTVDTQEELGEWQRELVADQTNIFRLNSSSIFPTYSGENAWFVQEIDDDTEAIIRFNDIEVIGNLPVVRFWHRINTEFARNGGFVEISTDGVIWNDAKDLFIRNGYECPLAFTTFAIPALDAFSGRTGENDYVDSYIDLSTFKNQTVSLRFRFGTNAGDMGTANDETFPVDGGWFIDDIDLIDLVVGQTQACITTTDDEACTEELISLFDPQFISGVDDFAIEGVSFGLYPNPAGDFLTLDISSDKNMPIKINMINMSGQLVYSQNEQLQTNKNLFQLNTSNIPSGIYLVQLLNENGVLTKKLIIE
jgi:hypothetical protein